MSIRVSIKSCMFTITIENLLHFLEYFDDNNNFHEEFSFRLCKSLFHPFIFWFCAQMQDDLKEKDRGNILHYLESYDHVASKSNLFQVFSFTKCYMHFVNGLFDHAAVK